MVFQEMSDNQRRVYIDTAQLYEAYLSAYHKGRAYRGGCIGKKPKVGNIYLDLAIVMAMAKAWDRGHRKLKKY